MTDFDASTRDIDGLTFTEMSPNKSDLYAGKQIMRDGLVKPYPKALLWNWATVQIPATTIALFDYLKAAQRRNAYLIRGIAKEDLTSPARRLKVNFLDEPTQLHFFDIDGHPDEWMSDPKAAVQRIVTQLGEPWASASFVWFFSGTHGMKTYDVGTGKYDKHGIEETAKYWRGEIVDGKIKVRLAFILARAVAEREAVALTRLLSATSDIKLDPCVSYQTQPNYTARIKWHEHPDRDVLGSRTRIGWVKGAHAFVDIPEVTAAEVRWAQAEGRGTGATIADHPDALTAVGAIGSNGQIREHMMSAVIHLLKATPRPPDVEVFDHAVDIADKLRDLIELNHTAVSIALARGAREWGSVYGYLPKNMADWAVWVMQHAPQIGRKTIRLAFEPRDDKPQADRQAIVDRVRRTVHGANEGVTLLIAPTGTFKSTEVRKAAVAYVLANPGKTVVILVPRHDLGAEQIRKLHEEHPDADFTAAVWRGRHRDDPETPDPDHPGKFKTMCWRDDEATELEDHLVDVNSHLCQRGRGKNKIKCAFYELCGAQRQRHTVADIWIGAHELIVHEMPEAFGNVGRIYIDEDPLDAFVFGDNGEVKIPLDALKRPPRRMKQEKSKLLMEGRWQLYDALAGITPPADEHLGAPATREALDGLLNTFVEPVVVDDADEPVTSEPVDWEKMGETWARFAAGLKNAMAVAVLEKICFPAAMARLEWHGKVDPPIRPDMAAKEVRELLTTAWGNATVRKLVLLWGALGHPGRVQVRQGEKGRDIHVMGLRPVAKGWAGVPTLITDATADATLLRYIWPRLRCEVEQWEQLPRPGGVKVFQCVDRSLSMDNIAIYGEGEALKRREDAALRMWAALLASALEYGGEPVGVIVYKSTREWIEENCFVPEWMTLLHHGGVAGMNVLEWVRALYVVGRLLPGAEAVTRRAEALTGEYLLSREYQRRKKAGKIPITPNAKGQNTVLTDIWEHPHPIAERIRRQVTEAGGNQNEGRARASLRGENSPLDIHRWHDVALPELGEAEAVLWEEIKVGLDALMLTGKGTAVWLDNVTHAAKAHSELFTAKALEKARGRAGSAKKSENERSPDILYKKLSIGDVWTPLAFAYQIAGLGQKPANGVSLLSEGETRAFLSSRVGALAWFEAVRQPEAGSDERQEAAE